ncbi:MAG: hypothetical protein AAGI53_13615 [Planctomycetota bacterium]
MVCVACGVAQGEPRQPGVSLRFIAVEGGDALTPTPRMFAGLDGQTGAKRSLPQIDENGVVLFSNTRLTGPAPGLSWAYTERSPGDLELLIAPFTAPLGVDQVWGSVGKSIAPDGSFVLEESLSNAGDLPIVNEDEQLRYLDASAISLVDPDGTGVVDILRTSAGNEGTLGLWAVVESTPTITGVVWVNDGTGVLVARFGEPMPNGTGSFSDFEVVGVAPDGVYFLADPRDGSGTSDSSLRSLWYGAGDGTAEVIRRGGAAPGLPGWTVDDFGETHDGGGLMALRARVFPTDDPAAPRTEVFYSVEGGIPSVLLVLEGAAPGVEGYDFAAIDRSPMGGWSAIKSDRIVFTAYITPSDAPVPANGFITEDDQVLYMLEDGQLRLLTREGDPVPGLGGRSYLFYQHAELARPILNNRGDFVLEALFIDAFLTGPTDLIMYDHSGDTFRSLIKPGDTAALPYQGTLVDGEVSVIWVQDETGNGATAFNDRREVVCTVDYRTDLPRNFDRFSVNAMIAVGGCNTADPSEPYYVFDAADTDRFIDAFVTQDAVVDIVPPFGVVDLDDLDSFIVSFLAGCP